MYNNITSFPENADTGRQEKEAEATKRREALQEIVAHQSIAVSTLQGELKI